MLQDNEEPVSSLKESIPIIEKQKLDSDIHIVGQNPIYKKKDRISINKNKEDSLDYSFINGGYFEKLDKSSVTAEKFKNRIFLGTDGNYYKSKKNKRDNYVWVLVEKK